VSADEKRGKRCTVMGALVMAMTAVIGIVFIAAASEKILHPADFAENIFNYQAVPDALINLTAVFLPWLELVLGVAMLFVSRYRLPAAWLALVLLIFFTALVAITVMRGIDVSCGCFSVDPDAGRVGWKKVAENIGLICLAAGSVVGLSRRRM